MNSISSCCSIRDLEWKPHRIITKSAVPLRYMERFSIFQHIVLFLYGPQHYCFGSLSPLSLVFPSRQLFSAKIPIKKDSTQAAQQHKADRQS